MSTPPLKVTFTGHKNFLRGLKSLQQPELKAVVRPALHAAAKKFTVPAIREKAVFAGSGRDRGGKRGKKGPIKRSVSTKYIKAKSLRKHGAMTGVTTEPRAWYSGFVSGGTRRHSVAKDAKLKSGKFQDRGPWVKARGNEFIGRGQRASEVAVIRRVNRMVFINYKRRAKAK